jgi:hypothetical protein
MSAGSVNSWAAPTGSEWSLVDPVDRQLPLPEIPMAVGDRLLLAI